MSCPFWVGFKGDPRKEPSSFDEEREEEEEWTEETGEAESDWLSAKNERKKERKEAKKLKAAANASALADEEKAAGAATKYSVNVNANSSGSATSGSAVAATTPHASAALLAPKLNMKDDAGYFVHSKYVASAMESLPPAVRGMLATANANAASVSGTTSKATPSA